MDFKISEKHNCIYVKLFGPEPWRLQDFYPMIDKMNIQINQMYQKKKGSIVFNFLELNFLDSNVISMLVQTSRMAESEKNFIIVTNKEIITLITPICIDKLFIICKTEEEWLNNN